MTVSKKNDDVNVSERFVWLKLFVHILLFRKQLNFIVYNNEIMAV